MDAHKASANASYTFAGRDAGFVYVTPNQDDGTANSLTYQWLVTQPKTTSGYATGIGVGIFHHNSTFEGAGSHCFGYRTTTAFDGIKITTASGTITAGSKLSVYGITN